MADWTWKPKETHASGLLYEPGNWGDLLKGAWVLATMRFLVSTTAAQPMTYCDPFAGEPITPLTAGTSWRLHLLGDCLLQDTAQPFVTGKGWPSAALLARCALTGQNAEICVTDADADRRQSWQTQDRVTVIDETDGWHVVTQIAKTDFPMDEHSLLLIDPYDVLAEWNTRLESIVEAANQTNVLLYIYNRSARGAERLRDYHKFRNRLQDLRGEHPLRIGRVAADSFLPNAHHEMLLLPCPGLLRQMEIQPLFDALEEESLSVAQAVTRGETIDR